MNYAIPLELSSFQYSRVDQAAVLIAQHSRGALIAKLNLHSAYRKVPVHPGNNYLLAIEWQGITYADHTLLFELRSTLKLFTAVTDRYTWALIAHGITDFIHYLDDFLSWLAPDSPDCLNSLNTAEKF